MARRGRWSKGTRTTVVALLVLALILTVVIMFGPALIG